MKKLMIGIICMGMFIGAGCVTTSNQQNAITVATTAGNTAGLLWIVSSNPTVTQEQEIITVLNYVNTYASNTTLTNNTFTSALYQIAVNYVNNSNIPVQDKPIVILGVGSALNAIDLYAVANPQYFTTVANDVPVLVGFDNGVISALSLPSGVINKKVQSCNNCKK